MVEKTLKDGQERTEEQLEILLEMLYDFYTASEIQKIYKKNITFHSYDGIMNEINEI